jgi:hypothetical protein
MCAFFPSPGPARNVAKGRLHPFAAPLGYDRYLREADGWSRREGDIAGLSGGRCGWGQPVIASAPGPLAARNRLRLVFQKGADLLKEPIGSLSNAPGTNGFQRERRRTGRGNAGARQGQKSVCLRDLVQ